MTAQAISNSSLICMGRHQRAQLMRAANRETADRHGTGFLYGIHETRKTETELALTEGELQRLPQRDLSIRCISGEIWLTRHGDIEDYFLRPGQALTVGRDDQTVIQALRESRYCLGPA